MKKFIYAIICLIIVLCILYFKFNNKIELFSNSNKLKDNIFSNEDTKIKNLENFSIINTENPSSSSYVLKQSSFKANKSYDITLITEKDQYYYFSYWRGRSKNYDGNNDNIEILGNNKDKISNCGKIIKTNLPTNEGHIWDKIVYIINTSNFENLNIKLGSIGKFTQGYRLFCELELKRYLPDFPNFNYQDGLESICIVTNKLDNKTILKSNNSRNHIIFNRDRKIKNGVINLKNSSCVLSNVDNILNRSFSIIIGYKAKLVDNGILLNIDSNNEIVSDNYKGGISISLNSDIDINNNNITVRIGNLKYMFNPGIINRMIHYTITYDHTIKNKSDRFRLYIDDIMLKQSDKIENIIQPKEKGTCPDKFKLNKNNICSYKGENLDVTDILKEKGTINKLNYTWDNCDKLNEIGQRARSDDLSCKLNDKLDFKDNELTINSDKKLSGDFKSFILYKKHINKTEISDINRYLSVQYLKFLDNTQQFFVTPDILKNKNCVN